MDSTIIAAIIAGLTDILASVLPVYIKHKQQSKIKRLDTKSNAESGYIEIPTWGGKASFKYNGSVAEGTEIRFGKSSKAKVSRAQYSRLMKEFKGKSINVASSFSSTPKEGTLEEWLKKNVTKVSISTYVASILKNEGYAVRNSQGQIDFNH